MFDLFDLFDFIGYFASPSPSVDNCAEQGLDTAPHAASNCGHSPERVTMMDDTYRLKIKLGMHEFEAEGPVQVVQAQFAAFKELVAVLPTMPPPPMTSAPTATERPQMESADTDRAPAKPDVDAKLDKIMKLENRTVSLTARPDSPENAVLLMLYGQKILRANDAVTGAEVMQGIANTGGLQIPRADRMLDKLSGNGDVIVIGERRSRRYRLTNAGLAKARQAANDLLAIVA